MATLSPIYQKFFKVYANRVISVSKVKTTSTSDSFTLPIGIVVSGNPSVGQIKTQFENQITSVSQSSSTGVVTLTTPAAQVGQTVTIVGLHTDVNATSVG